MPPELSEICWLREFLNFFDTQTENLEEAYQKYTEKLEKNREEISWDNVLTKEVDFTSVGNCT